MSRLDETAVREQVVNALLNSTLSGSAPPSVAKVSPPSEDEIASSQQTRQSVPYQGYQGVSEYDSYSLVSPLDMMAAAVTANSTSGEAAAGSQMTSPLYGQLSRTASAGLVDERLASYFGKAAIDSMACDLLELTLQAPQTTQQRDWQILDAQPVGSTLRLDPAACDPITARLIDHSDVSYYFEL